MQHRSKNVDAKLLRTQETDALESYATMMAGKMVQATACYLVRGDEVLLAMKKRGYGAGKWNCVGGKVEPGETVEEAAMWETQEEIGVTISSMKKVGLMHFYDSQPEGKSNFDMHVFISDRWKGEPAESDEVAPKWFKMSDIPYKQIWVDDELWLARILNGECIEASFVLEEEKRVLASKIVPAML